jgi:hypothetical protein
MLVEGDIEVLGMVDSMELDVGIVREVPLFKKEVEAVGLEAVFRMEVYGETL